MNPLTTKVLLMMRNPDMVKVLTTILERHCPPSNIHTSTDEHDALWQATDIRPDLVIIGFGYRNGKPHDLLRRLRASQGKFLGIVVYDPESEEYNTALHSAISRDPEFYDILPVRIDGFGEKMREIFNGTHDVRFRQTS